MYRFMTLLETCFQTEWAERMGCTLLHSLWQIALIAAAYAIVALLLRNRAASTRYAVGCVALLGMLGLPLSTFFVLPKILCSLLLLISRKFLHFLHCQIRFLLSGEAYLLPEKQYTLSPFLFFLKEKYFLTLPKSHLAVLQIKILPKLYLLLDLL